MVVESVFIPGHGFSHFYILDASSVDALYPNHSSTKKANKEMEPENPTMEHQCCRYIFDKQEWNLDMSVSTDTMMIGALYARTPDAWWMETDRTRFRMKYVQQGSRGYGCH